MRNMISLLIGCVALVMVAIAFIPFLGWANWLIIPLAILGLDIGATSGQSSGRTLNLIVIVIGVLRLMLGGGLF
jgi:hypothetical protein